MRAFLALTCALLAISCGAPPSHESKQSPAAQPASAPKPEDESRRFPQANLKSTEVLASSLLNKPFMPGGTLAHYKKGKADYQMFVARAANATDAAIKVSDWRKVLSSPEFVASFGGYFGQDGGVPVFVFAKGDYVAGVVGLSRAEADAAARTLAVRL